MYQYLALLRGINVGGKSLIKMADLREAMVKDGFKNVSTYIQSGNVIFESAETDKQKLAKKLQKAISSNFNLDVDIVIFGAEQWCDAVKAAPSWWGKDDTWKHNMLVMVTDDAKNVLTEIGELKPGIEKVEAGLGVVYQSTSWKDFGKTRSGKLASLPIYKKMTVRNYNTSVKLAELLG